ncbi:membrane-associated protein, putative [Bodo saltans]|uniref:Membrane-associated protein, putative n=1 Tax=Bodo saltans TaxID=75058 RepID=A0A0S4JJH7_BODSA|nr:membrane-associated protein, putative [Bodo saltans]|eukprot:CUG89335.1 membrane-associated protein, putative [Bodo saltans]
MLLVPGYVATVLVTSFLSACIDFFTTSVVDISPVAEHVSDDDSTEHEQQNGAQQRTTRTTTTTVTLQDRRSKRTYLSGFLATILHIAVILAAGYFALERSYFHQRIPIAWHQAPRFYTWHQSLVIAVIFDIVIVDPFFLLVSYSADLLMLRVFFACVERVVVGFYRLRLSLRRALARKAPTVQSQEPFAEEIIFGPTPGAGKPRPPTALPTDGGGDDQEDERGNSNHERRRAHERYLQAEAASRKPQIHAKERARIEELRRTRRAIFGVNEIFGDESGDDDDLDDLFVQFDDEVSPRRASLTSRAINIPSRKAGFGHYNRNDDEEEEAQQNSSPRFDDVYKPPTHYDLVNGRTRHNPFGDGNSSDENENVFDGDRFDAASMRSSEGGLFEPISGANLPNGRSQIDAAAHDDAEHREVDGGKDLEPFEASTPVNDDTNDRWLLFESQRRGGSGRDVSPLAREQEGETGRSLESLVAPRNLMSSDVLEETDVNSDSSSSDVEIVFEEEEQPVASADLTAALALSLQELQIKIPPTHENQRDDVTLRNDNPPSESVLENVAKNKAAASDQGHRRSVSASSIVSSSNSTIAAARQQPARPRGEFESDPFDLYVATTTTTTQPSPPHHGKLNPPTTSPRHALIRGGGGDDVVGNEVAQTYSLAVPNRAASSLPLPPRRLPARAQQRQALLLHAAVVTTEKSKNAQDQRKEPLPSTAVDSHVDPNHPVVMPLPEDDISVAAPPHRDVSPVPSELYHDLARYALDSPSSSSFRVTAEMMRSSARHHLQSQPPLQRGTTAVADAPMSLHDDFIDTDVMEVASEVKPSHPPLLIPPIANPETEEHEDFREIEHDEGASSLGSAETIMVDLAGGLAVADEHYARAATPPALLGPNEAGSDDDFAEVSSNVEEPLLESRRSQLPGDDSDHQGSDDDGNFFDPLPQPRAEHQHQREANELAEFDEVE